MVKKDPTQGDSSPDRVLDEEKDEGFKNDSQKQDELFQETDNNSTASEDKVNEYLIILFYNNIKHLDNIEDEDRRELFHYFYNNLGRPWFKTLIGYLLEHKAIMWETFSQVYPWYKQQNFYRSLRILRPFIRKVKISNPDLITQGNQPKIYMWKWASPKDFHNEQGRYAQFLLEEKEAEREYIRQEQKKAIANVEAQSEARALEVQNLTDQVFDAMPRPLEKTKLAPVHVAMNLVGVDPALWDDVRDAVLGRIQEVHA